MRKLICQKTNAHIFAFDSVAEISQYADPTKFKKKENSFSGVELKTWEEVQAKAISAWEEGMMILADSVEQLRKEPLPEIKSRSRSFTWSFTEGDEMDTERMLAGEPYWKHYSREESSGPTEVTIITDTTTPFHMDPMDVLWRGAVAVALAILLEEKGYRVELWVVNGSLLYSDKSHGVCTAACLKKTSDPLDKSTLINVMSGWFYRNAIFTLLESICQKENEYPANGYGSCYSPRPEDLDEISKDQNRVYSAGVYTYNGALSVIRAEIERITTKE